MQLSYCIMYALRNLLALRLRNCLFDQICTIECTCSRIMQLSHCIIYALQNLLALRLSNCLILSCMYCGTFWLLRLSSCLISSYIKLISSFTLHIKLIINCHKYNAKILLIFTRLSYDKSEKYSKISVIRHSFI